MYPHRALLGSTHGAPTRTTGSFAVPARHKLKPKVSPGAEPDHSRSVLPEADPRRSTSPTFESPPRGVNGSPTTTSGCPSESQSGTWRRHAPSLERSVYSAMCLRPKAGPVSGGPPTGAHALVSKGVAADPTSACAVSPPPNVARSSEQAQQASTDANAIDGERSMTTAYANRRAETGELTTLAPHAVVSTEERSRERQLKSMRASRSPERVAQRGEVRASSPTAT